jgi:hypothetical protein
VHHQVRFWVRRVVYFFYLHTNETPPQTWVQINSHKKKKKKKKHTHSESGVDKPRFGRRPLAVLHDMLGDAAMDDAERVDAVRLVAAMCSVAPSDAAGLVPLAKFTDAQVAMAQAVRGSLIGGESGYTTVVGALEFDRDRSAATEAPGRRGR